MCNGTRGDVLTLKHVKFVTRLFARAYTAAKIPDHGELLRVVRVWSKHLIVFDVALVFDLVNALPAILATFAFATTLRFALLVLVRVAEPAFRGTMSLLVARVAHDVLVLVALSGVPVTFGPTVFRLVPRFVTVPAIALDLLPFAIAAVSG